MTYHLINTDLRSMPESPSQYWIDNQCACTTGPKEPYGTRDLGGVAEGDILFMYENRIGIIAAGTVTHPWDWHTHDGDGIYAGADLYKINVNWFADIRDNPISVREIKTLGWGKFNGTRIPIKKDNIGNNILAAINNRVNHVPLIETTASEKTKKDLPRTSLEDFLVIQERKSEIGQAGESIAFEDELRRVHEKCPTPKNFVTQISTNDVGRGYDIESTYPGHERSIEVKTSTKDVDSFYLSDNERNTLKQLGQKAWIYIVKLEQDGSGQVVKRLQDPMNSIPESAFKPITAWKVTLPD